MKKLLALFCIATLISCSGEKKEKKEMATEPLVEAPEMVPALIPIKPLPEDFINQIDVNDYEEHDVHTFWSVRESDNEVQYTNVYFINPDTALQPYITVLNKPEHQFKFVNYDWRDDTTIRIYYYSEDKALQDSLELMAVGRAPGVNTNWLESE